MTLEIRIWNYTRELLILYPPTTTPVAEGNNTSISYKTQNGSEAQVTKQLDEKGNGTIQTSATIKPGDTINSVLGDKTGGKTPKEFLDINGGNKHNAWRAYQLSGGPMSQEDFMKALSNSTTSN